ncbi:unnamed protein product [Allacma fusca]|uniref:F-actin monooxygenase n=1 Tax=Allacma fusca TaxID=39272 RepID=A0A8J2K5K5_9HEXA|nr:unnamed protein product [Allacma fusca]
MDSRGRTKASQISAQAVDYFDKFCAADSLESIMSLYKKLSDVIDVKPTNFPDFFPKVMATLTSADAQELLHKYSKRAAQKCYENGKAASNSKVLIIGAGPCGLRTAIDAQLLGAKVVLIEKRQSFSRNNVLHLWPFVIADLKGLGAKKFYGKFCPGAIDHISINKLQYMLLKVALLIGVEIHLGIEFQNVIKPTIDGESKKGWRAKINPSSHPVSNYEFDILIGADGRRNTLKGFKRKVLRAKLAIAITANFVNSRSAAEAKVQEISGVSFIFKQDFFNELCQATGIDLENIVYYKDETHYFVMTAKKHSLLWKGVLYDDYAETERLLSPDNVDRDALENYVIQAVNFATDNKLPNLKFALNYRKEPDVALIDFTEMYQAENACRAVQRKGYKLLLGLVGDSLLEPFWPTGSGCARGFLSSFDMCWTIRSWAKGSKTIPEVIAERESIYRLLAQCTHENLSKDHSSYSAEPQTRYPYINLGTVKPFQVQTLFDSDENQGSLKLQSTPAKNKQQPVAEKNKQPYPNSSTTPATTTATPAIPKTVKKTQAASTKEQKATAEEETFPDIEEILNWFRSHVQPYGLTVDGIQDVYVNGDVLCAIIHRFRPDLLPEFPLPPEVQQGDDAAEQASYRNQLAFDFLKGEYCLPCIVNGFDSIQNVSANLSKLLDYTVHVYETFKRQKPQLLVRPQVNPAASSINFANSPPAFNSFHSASDFVYPDPDGEKPKGYVSCVWTTSTNFMKDDDNDSDTLSNASSRRLRRSSSIQRIAQRLENNSQSSPPQSYLPPDCSRFQDRNHIQNQFTSSDEMRRKRMEEADKSKVETLKIIHTLHTKQKEERDEERAAERERFIKSLRAQQVYEPQEPTSPVKTVDKDDFFNEYNLRLWRKSKPSMTERTQNLETKLFNTGLERTSSFCSQPAAIKKLEPPPQFKQGLVRSATECQVKGTPMPANVQKFRRDEGSRVKALGSKLTEGHGHTSVNTYYDPTKKVTPKPKVEVKQQVKPQPLQDTKQPAKAQPEVKSQGKAQLEVKSQIRAHSEGKALAKSQSRHSYPSSLSKPSQPTGMPKDTKTIQEETKKSTEVKKSNSSVSSSSKKPEQKPKKNDFSEYFRAKEQSLAKSKSTSNFSITRARSDVGSSTQSIESRAKLLTEEKPDPVRETNALRLKRSMLNEGLRPGLKLQINQPESSPTRKPEASERQEFSIKAEPSNKPRVARQSTVDEFEELFGISEHDEEVLTAMTPDEINHLLDWTEKTFSFRKGVETE